MRTFVLSATLKNCVLACLLVAVCLSGTASAAPPTYHITAIPSLDSYLNSGNRDQWGLAQANSSGQSLVDVSVTDAGGNFFGSELHDNGTVILLPGLPKQNGGISTSTQAVAINAQGDVIGGTHTNDPFNDAPDIAWLYKGGVTTGIVVGIAAAINDKGQIVGWETPIFDNPHAFATDAGGAFWIEDHVDAASANWRLYRANAINNQGLILGDGAPNGNDSGPFSFFVARPIPEPNVVVLMVLGALVVPTFVRRYRRNR
jgi:probable HAF family extracellular repeat protein